MCTERNLRVFTVSLTDEERASDFKLGDARLAFDVKCSEYIHQRPDLIPAGALNRNPASSSLWRPEHRG